MKRILLFFGLLCWIFGFSQSKVTAIEGITIEDKSDPRALEILKKVNRMFRENSPKTLDSYSYKSYEKISLDIDEDSISQYNKFFEETGMFREKRRKDSLNNISARKIFCSSGKGPRNSCTPDSMVKKSTFWTTGFPA
jgi:hypothetical protein